MGRKVRLSSDRHEKCLFCGATFGAKFKLNQHVKKNHDGRGMLQAASDDVAVRYILHLLSKGARHIWVF